MPARVVVSGMAAAGPPDFDGDVSGEYSVEVLGLRGDVLDRYFAYRDSLDNDNTGSWGHSARFQIDIGGYAYSPDRDEIRHWKWPAIAVAYKNGGFTDGVFPEPASIVGYVAAERLGDSQDRPVFLHPMGLTKTPVGHGCRYRTRLRDNKDRLAVRDDGTVRARPGVYWANNLAARLFGALRSKYPGASIVSRFATKNGSVPNPMLVHLATEFPGKVFIGYGRYTECALRYPEEGKKLDALVSSWFGRTIHRPEIVFDRVFDHDYESTDRDAVVRLETLRDNILRLGPGAPLTCHRRAPSRIIDGHTLTVSDVEQARAIDLSVVSNATLPPVPFPDTFPRSPLEVNTFDRTEKVGDAVASYANTYAEEVLYSSRDVTEGTGMLFLVAPESSGSVRSTV